MLALMTAGCVAIVLCCRHIPGKSLLSRHAVSAPDRFRQAGNRRLRDARWNRIRLSSPSLLAAIAAMPDGHAATTDFCRYGTESHGTLA